MKQIILVEDDEPIRDVFHIIFKESDCQITDLTNGEKILEGEIDAPDLFILDKQISGTDGLDICRFIKSNDKYKHVPVVMLSANPDIMTLARQAGADMAIAKPFSLKQLREVVTGYTTESNTAGFH